MAMGTSAANAEAKVKNDLSKSYLILYWWSFGPYLWRFYLMVKCCFCNQEITKEDLRDEICDRCWDFEVMPDKVDLDYQREEIDDD
jgi:hypothetical protein